MYFFLKLSKLPSFFDLLVQVVKVVCQLLYSWFDSQLKEEKGKKSGNCRNRIFNKIFIIYKKFNCNKFC